MNEISVLMYLLSKKSNIFQIGASEDEILKALNFKDKNKSIYFQNLLNQFSKYIEPLGLQIRFNPLNSHWYISFDSDTTEIISANPFNGKARLAATLFCTLVCCFNNSGMTQIQKIKELRKKKDIWEDLKELKKRGFIEIDKNLNHVYLTPLIGYLLDLEKLFIKISLELKK